MLEISENWTEAESTIGELKELFLKGDYEIEVDSPDGFVSVIDFIDSGIKEGIIINDDFRCSLTQPLQLIDGTWLKGRELKEGMLLMGENGDVPIDRLESIEPEEMYDITVNHPNHRYWAGGISTHNCSSGCEPHFMIVTEKHVMDQDKLIISNRLFEEIGKEQGFYTDTLLKKIIATSTVIGHDEIPAEWQDIFMTAQEISTEDHIAMQGILQRNGVDSSISKTINMPNSASIEEVRAAYLLGHKEKCKGLTIYRDGSRDEQVLNKVGTALAGSQADNTELPNSIEKEELADILPGTKYRLADRDAHSMSITICFDEHENPKEVFAGFEVCADTDYKDKATMWTTTCRLISAALRYGIPLTELIDQLDKSTGHMLDLPAQLSKLFKSFLSQTKKGYSVTCPECKKGYLVFEEGCNKCYECGFSKCQ